MMEESKSSEMFADDSGDTIVCEECGETCPLFTAYCTGTINRPVIWHCGPICPKQHRRDQ